MRFSAKMALSTLALLGVLFAVGGYYMIQQNYETELGELAQSNAALHAQQKYILKSMLLEAEEPGVILPDSAVSQAGEALAKTSTTAQGLCAVMTGGYAMLYSNLPQEITKTQRIAVIGQGEDTFSYAKCDGTIYQMMASALTIQQKSFWLVSAFDVTQAQLARTRQLHLFWRLYAVLMVGAAVLSAALATLLTRPLRKLSLATRAIAAGAYTQRLHSRRTDEIGALSRNFDDMAQAVEDKVYSLELSVQQREDFVGAFTHELKTPMTAMLGYAALLQKNGTDASAREKAIAYIHSETKRLEILSQKLLYLLGLSEEAPILREIKLAEIFEKTRQTLVVFPEALVEFEMPREERVMVEPDLLVDMLYNLIQNAIHASPPQATVQVGYAMLGGGCRITVRDSGKGIPAGELTRITEPFYRVDKARAKSKNGTGLGLAICAKIAALHQTALCFESEENIGTAVSFTLPVKEAISCEQKV